MNKMKYAFLAVCFVATSAMAQDTTTTTTYSDSSASNYDSSNRMIQVGGDFLLPYRIDKPSGRTAELYGAHMEVFIVPAWAISLEGVFGTNDNGFSKNPLYISPGMSFYGAPGRTIEPFIRADVPILINNGQDFGVRGGLGFLWNLGVAGLGLRYSFDATYFFDQEATSLNLAHVSAVFNW